MWYLSVACLWARVWNLALRRGREGLAVDGGEAAYVDGPHWQSMGERDQRFDVCRPRMIHQVGSGGGRGVLRRRGCGGLALLAGATGG